LFLLLSVFYHGYLTAAMFSRGSIWPAASSPRYSPPNSRVRCGNLSNVRHEVCALQRTYFVRSCGPRLKPERYLYMPAYQYRPFQILLNFHDQLPITFDGIGPIYGAYPCKICLCSPNQFHCCVNYELI
jgi:hypothetical protein